VGEAGGEAAGARRRLAGGSPALLDLKLRYTVLNVVSTYMKLRSSRTYPVQKGGGSGDLDSLHRKGAACTSPACERRCYGLVCAKQKGG
jgi:hypothetical protein